MSEMSSREPLSGEVGVTPRIPSAIGARPLAHVAGALGIAGQVASAYWYLLYPLLAVPTPASYAFFAAWFVLVGLTVAWWRHHPIRSFFVPIGSVPAVVFALWIGTSFLGWAP